MYSTNGYNITPAIVTDILIPIEKVTSFPFIQIYFSEENYSTSDTNKQSSGILEKELLVAIDVWGKEDEDPQLWRDQVIADFDKFFDTNYFLPRYNDPDNHSLRDLRIEKNISFGGDVNRPQVGVGFSIIFYYGQVQKRPDLFN